MTLSTGQRDRSKLDADKQHLSSLPTMYDLPSENPEEPGLPDEFHALQPQLLSRSLQLTDYTRQEMFSALDMNLYYDPEHTSWYKRPDWFLVAGVSRLYQGHDSRSSYVLWDEKVAPIVVVEFLSPGTESEDLGRFAVKPPRSKPGKPPCKFEVYEQIIKVQNYVVYDEVTQRLRYFRLVNGRYQEQPIAAQNPRLWIPELGIGLGTWVGPFDELPQTWLRWCDASGAVLPTDTEQEQQATLAERQARLAERQARLVEQQAKETAENQLHQTVRRLRSQGMAVEMVAEVTGFSIEDVERIAAE
jgi:Uma2 family endonuclease